MDPLQRLGVHPLPLEQLEDGLIFSLTADHAQIGQGMFHRLTQTRGISPVAPGNDDHGQVGMLLPGKGVGQVFLEGGAHGVHPRLKPLGLGKLLPVVHHRHLVTQHPPQSGHGHRHMAAAADEQGLFPAQALHQHRPPHLVCGLTRGLKAVAQPVGALLQLDRLAQVLPLQRGNPPH